MNNENQETIADIVADIRAQNQGLPEDDYALSPLVADLLSFADRIEAAEKQSVTDCNRLGDAAKMREAFANISEYAKTAACHTEDAHLLGYLNQIGSWAEAALSDTPRNCDRFINAKDALKAFERETGESMAIEFIKWLFAEAKGEEK